MELYDVMRTTGAVREFTQDALSDDILRRILENARFAPTGGNRQGVRIVVVHDMAIRERLAELTIPGGQRYLAQAAHGESPWNPLSECGVDAQTIAATDASMFGAPLVAASVVLVFCIDLGVVAALDQDLDRISVVGGASVYPFVWNVLLGARYEGFGGVLTTMVVSQEPAVRDLLGIPEQFAVAAVVPLGKPVHQVKKLTRKPLQEIATYNRFDGPSF